MVTIDVDPEVARAFDQAIAALRGAGLQLEDVDPGFSSPGTIQRRLFAARAAHTVRALDGAQRARLDPAIVVAAEEGEKLSALDYLQAEAERVELIATLARFYTRYDLLLTPTSAAPAPLVDATASARESFAGPFSLYEDWLQPKFLTQALKELNREGYWQLRGLDGKPAQPDSSHAANAPATAPAGG